MQSRNYVMAMISICGSLFLAGGAIAQEAEARDADVQQEEITVETHEPSTRPRASTETQTTPDRGSALLEAPASLIRGSGRAVESVTDATGKVLSHGLIDNPVSGAVLGGVIGHQVGHTSTGAVIGFFAIPLADSIVRGTGRTVRKVTEVTASAMASPPKEPVAPPQAQPPAPAQAQPHDQGLVGTVAGAPARVIKTTAKAGGEIVGSTVKTVGKVAEAPFKILGSVAGDQE